LAAINIPQVLGYARIAGMPVVTGLYTVLLPLLAFAVVRLVATLGRRRGFGNGRHSRRLRIAYGDSRRSAAYVGLVGTVALLTAAWLLLVARLFKLGFLADFLSRTVLTGFLTGVGIQVAIANARRSLRYCDHVPQLPGAPVGDRPRTCDHPNLPTLSLAAFVITP
jgi:SulP family sulfate permease